MASTELRALKEHIQDHLSMGFIKPSVSPLGAPILFVNKKYGTLYMCINYRKLNKVII